MILKRAGGKVYGASFTVAEKKAMDKEIERQLAEHTRKHYMEIDAMFLWFLHEEFGFGLKNMRRAYMRFTPRLKELCDRYEMHEDGDNVWLCTHKLKEYGADLEQWERERGD